MARNNVNFSEVEKLRDNLQRQLSDEQIDQFMESCAKELTARLLAKVKRRTPVGQYKDRVGGTLRRGWDVNTKQGIKVHHFDDVYVVEVINPVEYASYVEFGHRTRDHKGWVKGRFMLTISEEELKRDAPNVLEKKLKKMLEGCFKK